MAKKQKPNEKSKEFLDWHLASSDYNMPMEFLEPDTLIQEGEYQQFKHLLDKKGDLQFYGAIRANRKNPAKPVVEEQPKPAEQPANTKLVQKPQEPEQPAEKRFTVDDYRAMGKEPEPVRQKERRPGLFSYSSRMRNQSKKAYAKERADKLLERYDVKVGPRGETYQLISKEDGNVHKGPLTGLDVNAGLFSPNRRQNKLIGRELVLQSGYDGNSTRSQVPTNTQPSQQASVTPGPAQTETPIKTNTPVSTEVTKKATQPIEEKVTVPKDQTISDQTTETSTEVLPIKVTPIPRIGQDIDLSPKIDPFPTPEGYPEKGTPEYNDLIKGLNPPTTAKTETVTTPTGPDYNKILGYDLKNYMSGIDARIRRQLEITNKEAGRDLIPEIKARYGSDDTQALMQWYDATYPNRLGKLAGSVRGIVDKYGTHEPTYAQINPNSIAVKIDQWFQKNRVKRPTRLAPKDMADLKTRAGGYASRVR